MIHRNASLLMVLFALAFAGCESSIAPSAPSAVPGSPLAVAPDSPEDAGPSVSSKLPDTGPVVIDRGELDFTAGFGEIQLAGTRGFSLVGHVHRSGGIVQAVEACSNSNCEPDTLIPLRALWIGKDLPATVTLDGETYTAVGGLSSPTSAWVEFHGSVTAPALTKRGEDHVTAPFTMSGRFTYPGGIVTFSGEGVVKVWLDQTPGSTGWQVHRLLYRFKHSS